MTLRLGCVVASAARLLLLCDFIDVPTYFKQHKVFEISRMKNKFVCGQLVNKPSLVKIGKNAEVQNWR